MNSPNVISLLLARKLVLLAGALVALGGCNIFESDDGGRKNGAVTPAAGGSGAGGTGGGAAGGSTSAGGDAGADPCGAPTGAAMVIVPGASGGKYCIDRTEVTQAQYQEFLTATKAAPGSEHVDCGENASYQPVSEPSSYEPATCILDVSWSPKKTPERPVVCIDWCDAHAYCKWAGKRLCGKIGGGSLEILGGIDTPSDPANDASQSEWFNACSQGGTTKYPYEDTYDAAACEGEAGGADWQAAKKNVGARAGCRGGTEPWASLRDLSGSVSEYTNECLTWVDPSTGKASKQCALRGGSFANSEPGLRCALSATSTTYTAEPQTGFRCCKDL